MDQELKAYLEGMEARMADRFERVETEARHTRVIVEGMDDKVRLLAEAIVGTYERIVGLREETTGRLDEIKGSVDMIHQILVPRVNSLEKRAKNLEDHVERRNVEAIDLIREKILSRQA